MMDRRRYGEALFGPRKPRLDALLRGALLGGGHPPMQVDEESARTLQVLTCLHRPRIAIELGTFVGYSAIHIARGLPPGGRLTTVECDAALAALARTTLENAGVGDRVDVVCADALTHLDSLPGESVDMIFIDAAKRAYPACLRASFRVLRRGGLLIADDACADGDYGGEDADDPDGRRAVSAIHTYNQSVARTRSLQSTLLTGGHGLMVSVKAPETAQARVPEGAAQAGVEAGR